LVEPYFQPAPSSFAKLRRDKRLELGQLTSDLWPPDSP